MNGEKAICDALCHILGNTCRISRTTRSYEWNVSGKGAELARQCFHEHSVEQEVSVVPIAHHIIGLGGSPIFDYSDGVVEVDPPSKDELPSLPEMINRLSLGHTQANRSIRAAVDIAQQHNFTTTVVLLAAQSEMHRLQRHRLSLLRGET